MNWWDRYKERVVSETRQAVRLVSGIAHTDTIGGRKTDPASILVMVDKPVKSHI